MNSTIWIIFISGIACAVSFITLWSNSLKKGKLTFICNNWVALPFTTNENVYAAFAVSIGVYNSGVRTHVLNDILLEITTNGNKRFYYNPLFLFDFNKFAQDIGHNSKINSYMNGPVPLPMLIEKSSFSTFKGPYEPLFMSDRELLSIPEDISSNDDTIKINVYASVDNKKYVKVGEKEFSKRTLAVLQHQSYGCEMPTAPAETRADFIKRQKL
jgi:hypothetical protein